jgi:hypothetical protein
MKIKKIVTQRLFMVGVLGIANFASPTHASLNPCSNNFESGVFYTDPGRQRSGEALGIEVINNGDKKEANVFSLVSIEQHPNDTGKFGLIYRKPDFKEISGTYFCENEGSNTKLSFVDSSGKKLFSFWVYEDGYTDGKGPFHLYRDSLNYYYRATPYASLDLGFYESKSGRKIRFNKNFVYSFLQYPSWSYEVQYLGEGLLKIKDGKNDVPAVYSEKNQTVIYLNEVYTRIQPF